MKNVAIIDYDMGNIDSVVRAVEECGGNALIASQPDDFERVNYIILPGVGSFTDGMKNIFEKRLDKTLYEQVIKKGVPFLGICLGMQLLADKGWEGGETQGLGWIRGEVKRLKPFDPKERIPHIGWDDVVIKNPSILFKDFHAIKDFYFVHSFHLICTNQEDILATTPYCSNFISAIGRNNIFGVQFHPEKSQKAGFQLLRNFLSI